MLKNRKSIAVILSLVMLLAMACGAWAVTGQIKADGVPKTVTDDIETTATGGSGYGVYALNGGIITFDDVYDILTSGTNGHGAYIYKDSKLFMSGDISTSGEKAHGAETNDNSYASLNGNIETEGVTSYGVYPHVGSSIDMTGTITTTGTNAHGAYVHKNSELFMNGTIKTSGEKAYGAEAHDSAYVSMSGDITTSGDFATGAYAHLNSSLDITTGSVITKGDKANGVHAYDGSSLFVKGDVVTSGYNAIGAIAEQASSATVDGNITVNGEDAYGLQAINNSIVNMNDGSITIADGSSSGINVEDGSVANLSGVVVNAQTLLITTTAGTLNAFDESELNGDVIHGGIGGTAENLEINLTDSTMTGSVLTVPGLGNMTGGTVDIALENGQWIVTGDSSTNGKLTIDEDSIVDMTQAPDGTVLAFDELVGEFNVNLKPGDQINITNSSGNNGDFSSSNPNVLEVVENEDGSWSLISHADGDVELTYTYEDPITGLPKEVTVGVTSGEGGEGPQSDPDNRGGGGSSNCNAGMGFSALFGLLGLALIQKRK